MKKLFVFLFIVMLCINFTGCTDNNDDNNKGDYNSKIVGTWGLYKDWYDGDYEYYDEGEFTITFKSNGSGYAYEDDGDDYGEDDRAYFDWKIKGSELYIKMEFDDGYSRAEIKSLKNDELILLWDDDDDGNYREYYERLD